MFAHNRRNINNPNLNNCIRVLPKRTFVLKQNHCLDFNIDSSFPSVKYIVFKRTEQATRRRGQFGVLTASFLIFMACYLLQSGDIEANPGPSDAASSDPKQQLPATQYSYTALETNVTHVNSSSPQNQTGMSPYRGDDHCGAISSREISMPFQDTLNILSSKLDNAQIASQASLASITEKIDLMSQRIEENQKTLQEELSSLKNNVLTARQKIEGNTSDIDKLLQLNKHTCQRVEFLESEVEKLLAHSRRNNLKFFGISEGKDSETYDACVDTVLNIMNIFFPDKTWTASDVEQAYRIGKTRNPDRPRPIIVRFYRWSDALRVLNNKQARDNMRAAGIRVAADLTLNQSNRLKEIKAQGLSGYYRHGRLYIRSGPKPPNAQQDRQPSQRSCPPDSRLLDWNWDPFSVNDPMSDLGYEADLQVPAAAQNANQDCHGSQFGPGSLRGGGQGPEHGASIAATAADDVLQPVQPRLPTYGLLASSATQFSSTAQPKGHLKRGERPGDQPADFRPKTRSQTSRQSHMTSWATSDRASKQSSGSVRPEASDCSENR